jgi:DNA repair protein RadA/Sms
MARPIKRFVCQSCGAVTTKWSGRCESCGEWNTIVEEAAPAPGPAGSGLARGGKGRALEFAGLRGATPQPPRYLSGIAEFDRVCGGGLVTGSALLIGGDPGIGKSTLLLQVAAALARQNTACAYISGEEALDQVRLRAERLGLADAPVQLTAATSVRDIVASLERPDAPRVAVIDSIQTMWLDTVDSTPGTVTQVRSSAQALVELAKRRGIAVLLVGHVTKDGAIAGPRVLEHMVDTVLYFEGERGHQFRILRTVKNRFGPTDEIGVFEMSDRGLSDVANPSALFLAERRGHVSGACVFAGIEGTRPVLVEIQALVSPSSLATPRRAVVGLGLQSPRHGASGSRGALRRQHRWQRRLPERGRRPQDRGAGRRSRGGGSSRLLARRRTGAGRHGGVRRDRSWWRSTTCRPTRGAFARSGEARLPQCAGAARPGWRRPCAALSGGHRH